MNDPIPTTRQLNRRVRKRAGLWYEYKSVPFVYVNTVQVTCDHVGEMKPMAYDPPDDEGEPDTDEFEHPFPLEPK
jgi:hypothetical protein